MDRFIKPLIVLWLLLAIVDMFLTYWGVSTLGMEDASFLINRVGLLPGIGIILLAFFTTAWLIWITRRFRIMAIASIAGLIMLCGIEVCTLTYNAVLLL